MDKVIIEFNATEEKDWFFQGTTKATPEIFAKIIPVIIAIISEKAINDRV